jgi:AcrR family transcriptional regulator
MQAPEADGTRRRILECASAIHTDRGLKALTMRAVASCAELSATAIYRHFEDKQALVAALCDEGFRRFAAHLWKALSADGPEQRLISTGARYADFALGEPHFYRIIFMAPVHVLGFDRLPEENREKFGATFLFLRDRVQECMRAGVLAEADPEEVSTSIWAHVHGLCALYLDGHFAHLSEMEFRARYDRSRVALIDGLRRRT